MRNSGEQWLIEADDAPELDAERRLYNTYYWLKRLTHPGVEVDWAVMERIDQQAQR